MVDRSTVKKWVVSLLAILLLEGCVVGYQAPIRATPGITASASGLVARIDSILCCVRWPSAQSGRPIRIFETVLSLRNDGERPIVLSPLDILLVDADGYTTPPDPNALHLQVIRLGMPRDMIEFERRWETQFRKETMIAPGAETTVLVCFPERINFDKLSAIRIRNALARMTLEIPLSGVNW